MELLHHFGNVPAYAWVQRSWLWPPMCYIHGVCDVLMGEGEKPSDPSKLGIGWADHINMLWVTSHEEGAYLKLKFLLIVGGYCYLPPYNQDSSFPSSTTNTPSPTTNIPLPPSFPPSLPPSLPPFLPSSLPPSLPSSPPPFLPPFLPLMN